VRKKERERAHMYNNYGTSVVRAITVTFLKEIIQKHEQEIQEKTSFIQQLEDVVEKQDQKIQLQDAIIKQLQEAIQKQSEEMQVLIDLTQQHRSLTASLQNSSAK
jgi:uncharacterized protein (DUF3084 family)